MDLSSLFSGDLLSGVPTYGGPLTAGMTPNEKSLLAKIMQGTGKNGTGSPAEKALMDIINNKGPNIYKPEGSLADFADMLASASNTGAYSATGNPYLQSAIEAAQRPTLEGLTETLTRDLPGRFTQAGQFVQPQSSSAFDNAAALASRGAAQSLSDIATNMSYQNYNAAAGRESDALGAELSRRFQGGEGNRERAIDAAKSLPGVTATEMQTLMDALKSEGLPRLIQQQGIDKGIDLFNKRVDDFLKVMGITAGVTQPTVSTQSSGKSSSAQFGLPSS
jgi:hypothetical protein